MQFSSKIMPSNRLVSLGLVHPLENLESVTDQLDLFYFLASNNVVNALAKKTYHVFAHYSVLDNSFIIILKKAIKVLCSFV